jgi:tetratricopeptide (TPR) repeat protein
MARRDGHRLFFQVNALPPLEFEEAQPLPAQGTLALIWPKGIGLTSLEAMRRPVPEGASPLERGDELMAASKYADALASYRAQVVAAGTGDKDVSQQARLKAAMCLVKLQRLSDAIPELERLAGESKSRWSAIASCELLQLYLNQGRTKDVDVLFDVLSENHSLDKLIPLMSKESRERLLRFYTEEVMETHLLYRPRAVDVRNLDRSMRVHDYFQIPKSGRLNLRGAYLRGYHFDGKLDQALQVADELLTDDAYWPGGRLPRDVIPVVERVSWILRQKGQAQAALTNINQYLAKDLSLAKDFKPLLLERARIHVALKQWDEAEKDIDEVLRLPATNLGYLRYADAHLAQGFLRQRRGDSAGAAKSWRAGLYTNYAPKTALPEVDALQTLPVIDVLRAITLAALADTLTPADADVLLDHLATRRGRSIAGDNPIPIRLPLPPGILRDMWRTPRGMECARKIAFQETAYAENLRMPLILLGAENAHQAAMPRALTPEQEALLWQTCERVYLSYMEEKLDATQVIALGFAWKGTIGFLGWGGVAPSLDPSVRGPLAYIIGQRYVTRLKMPAEALTLFETALRDAPVNSTLQRLARAEVDRLKKAK